MYHGRTVPGFPAHPHCGFETVTIVTRGFCDHADSLGAGARFGEGDVQWITTGKGLQHSEMFPLLDREGPNTLELFQLWLNLPASGKRVAPYFKMLWREQIPILSKAGASVRLIAGSMDGQSAPAPPPDSWAATPGSDIHIAIIDLEPHAEFRLEAPATGSHRRLYLFSGGPVRVNDTEVPSNMGAAVDHGVAEVRNGGHPARLLWLQGKPIGEPVAKYGPFVMNRPEEIEEVMAEFRRTQFGGWPWPAQDPVHPSEKGRFARFPDGNLVEK